ncbi:helix-turn-helix transcriptional regulator [Thaumasiovibrio sp. DFM-14]|uniref:helix-turn-helix transcriptional regulator n=1 Tax=Thaumasiovibrio sp. DFM-14 TaxID=3384792 RepID=UPI0039A1D81C
MTTTSILSVIQTIENSLPDVLSVELIAARSGLSRSYLQRQFKQATGLTISQYQRYRLLSLAAEKIATTNLRILDIAIEYGFESQEAFARAFKRFAMVAPKNIRNQPLWAKRLACQPIDKAMLDKLSVIRALDMRDEEHPAMRWACYAIRICSVKRDPVVIEARIQSVLAKFLTKHYAAQFNLSTLKVLEFVEHYQYASASFPLALGFPVEEEAPIPADMFEVRLPKRRMTSIELPDTGYISAFFFYLATRCYEEQKYQIMEPPYYWSLAEDNVSLRMWFPVRETENVESAEDIVGKHTLLDAVSMTVPVSTKVMMLSPEKHVGSRRLSTLFSDFPEALKQVALQSNGLVLFGDPSQSEEAHYQVYFSDEGSTEYQRLSGMYLVSDWQGDDINAVENGVERLYHALHHHSKLYIASGEEIIRSLHIDEQRFAFQLLTPVRRRRGR